MSKEITKSYNKLQIGSNGGVAFPKAVAMGYGKNAGNFAGISVPSTGDFWAGGLTFCKKCAKFFLDKGCDEDMRAGKIPREGAVLVQGIRNPAVTDTTSEPYARKCHTGCAR